MKGDVIRTSIMLIIIMVIVNTAGSSRECWGQNESSRGLNNIIKHIISHVVFGLFRHFSGHSHISYYSCGTVLISLKLRYSHYISEY